MLTLSPRSLVAGLTWARVSTVLALCVVWAFAVSVQDLLISWRHGELLEWLIWHLASEFACIVVIALTMAVPLVAVGNWAAPFGRRRIAALAFTIAVAAVLAGAERLVYVSIGDDSSTSSVRPALYFVWWTRYAFLASLLTILIEFQRRETRSIESMHRAEIDRLALDREMDEARLQVLQAQIEPHFLFNTLANVRRLYQSDLSGGRTMLQNLMRYLEVALPHMRQDRSTVARELTLVEAYLSVQHIRMGRRLSFEIAVPQSLRGLDLPPMMLLTLVENAIKHGLNPLPEGGTIVISAADEGETLRIDVADNGRGFHATSGGGTGLANIRARLAAMFDGRASLVLIEKVPRGVVSTLRLPMAPAPVATS